MENRAKLRFPRSLFSSLTSCKTQHLLSDVIHHRQPPLFSPSDSQIPFSSASIEPLLPPTSPPRRPPSSYPTMCRPRCPETFDEMVRENCILSRERRKVCDQGSAFFFDDVGKCPPASPASPLTDYFKLEKQANLKKKEKQRKKEKIKRKKKKDWRKKEGLSSKCSSSYEEWFSSDDEREEDDETETEAETLFSSSRSFLSLSSDPDSTGPNRIRQRRKPPSSRRRESRRKRSSEVSAVAVEEKVKGSFAVVKRSSDPYSDFRTSMVEMIMEKQIFGAGELEQLLQCFLSLNSPHHHRVIVEVFAEICEALFANLFC